MNKVAFIRDQNLLKFEELINQFCETHDVIASQFLDYVEGWYNVAMWYRVEQEVTKI